MSDSTAAGANGRHDALLAKVRKLLAKAEDPAVTDAEAEVYNAKAAELIAAYGIDRALLAASEPDTDRIGDRVVVLDAPYARDKADLLHGIAKALRCRTVFRNRSAAGNCRCTCSGTPRTCSASNCSTPACCCRPPPECCAPAPRTSRTCGRSAAPG